MTDRAEQARAEAERRVATKYEQLWDTEGEHLSHSWGEGFQAGFREAAEWADNNPHPRTLTRAEFEDAYTYWFDGFPSRETTFEFLWALGIEVEDDNE